MRAGSPDAVAHRAVPALPAARPRAAAVAVGVSSPAAAAQAAAEAAAAQAATAAQPETASAAAGTGSRGRREHLLTKGEPGQDLVVGAALDAEGYRHGLLGVVRADHYDG